MRGRRIRLVDTRAGEMMVDDGEVRLLNDWSGHYKPDNEMLYNTAARRVDGAAQAQAPEARDGSF